MRWLELRVPPPVVAVIAALAIWALRRLFPEEGVFIPGRRAIYGTLLAVGLLVVILGWAEFRRARTTVNPMQPDAASSLVTGGIYRWTRNPMYLGMALVLCAVAVFFSNPLGLAPVVVFIAWMNLFQIAPEERALRSRFGTAFDEYCERVRRWL
ncbi:MAG TPA: isoprenylcysteine carboxylmethyltransferase family protein [Burkholderiales bacterium]|nr:isoprenylcysteine carboxylmethyltransferase family protein [Burkholderiales bacterium]